MKCTLFLDVVILDLPSPFKTFPSIDESLFKRMVFRYSIIDLILELVYCVSVVSLNCDFLSSKSLHIEDKAASLTPHVEGKLLTHSSICSGVRSE